MGPFTVAIFYRTNIVSKKMIKTKQLYHSFGQYSQNMDRKKMLYHLYPTGKEQKLDQRRLLKTRLTPLDQKLQ